MVLPLFKKVRYGWTNLPISLSLAILIVTGIELKLDISSDLPPVHFAMGTIEPNSQSHEARATNPVPSRTTDYDKIEPQLAAQVPFALFVKLYGFPPEVIFKLLQGVFFNWSARFSVPK